MEHTKDRTWAEIRLDNIEHNYRAIRSRLAPSCRFLGTVKADAYGHGSITVSGHLRDLGAEYLAVACIEEAIPLRQSGIELPILVLGYTDPSRTGEIIDMGLTQAVYSAELARAYSHGAAGARRRIKCHLKIDTGMGRLGFDSAIADEMSGVMSLPGLEIEGIFSHFATSDLWGDHYTDEQFDSFKKTVAYIEAQTGKCFEIVHCANSGAVVNYPETYMDMVRPGIALYGAYDEPSPNLEGFAFKPGMELKTRIVQIKDMSKGATVSYGRTFTAHERCRIAVLPIGYADGLHRLLSNKMDMLLDGKIIKQVGRICMDMCMVDITNIDSAHVGDVVTVFGRDGGAEIPISRHSRLIDTITYELLCSVSTRVPRVYYR